jgi:hypothetical protein
MYNVHYLRKPLTSADMKYRENTKSADNLTGTRAQLHIVQFKGPSTTYLLLLPLERDTELFLEHPLIRRTRAQKKMAVLQWMADQNHTQIESGATATIHFTKLVLCMGTAREGMKRRQ